MKKAFIAVVLISAFFMAGPVPAADDIGPSYVINAGLDKEMETQIRTTVEKWMSEKHRRRTPWM